MNKCNELTCKVLSTSSNELLVDFWGTNLLVKIDKPVNSPEVIIQYKSMLGQSDFDFRIKPVEEIKEKVTEKLEVNKKQ
jgi:hypothetical protein